MIIRDMSEPLLATPEVADSATLPEHAEFVRLHDWGVIRASGADARSFLHSQLTQDMLGVAPTQARLAGYCSAKGRLLASFVVWLDHQGDVLLACSADALASTLKRLSMFVLRAKCKLTDASADVSLWGVWGASGLPVPWQCSRQGERVLVGLPAALHNETSISRALLATPAAWCPGPSAQAAGSADVDLLATWRWLEVHSATARVVAATQEQFVPQMVNLELSGGVNFQKGCYPGQEVVARSQYRGTLKRRGYVLQADAVAQPGQEVFQADDPGQPAGQVVLAASWGGQHAVFAELKIAAAQAGALHLGAPDGPTLRAVSQPYRVDVERD